MITLFKKRSEGFKIESLAIYTFLQLLREAYNDWRDIQNM